LKVFNQPLLASHQNIVKTDRDITGQLMFKQDIAESEQQIAIAVHSRSSTEDVVTTVVQEFVTVGHGVP